jgi:transcriptional regulator with XRE-family HTH domain
MTLAEYMAEIGIKDEPMAKMIGLKRSMVTRLRNGTAKPSFNTLIAIERVTGGKVRASDFVAAA